MEVFLKKFNLVSISDEEQFFREFRELNKYVFNTPYPLGLFTSKEFEEISFEPITIFYGGNGSGKTTLLNIIANKIHAERRNIDNRGQIFEKYVSKTECQLQNMKNCEEIKMISSDDVFDYLLDVRAINSGVNRRKDDLVEEYNNNRYGENHIINALEEYDRLKKINSARNNTNRQYMREQLRNNNIIQHSNGESALDFWQEQIDKNGIYLLDEPENSLSAENILKLKKYIEDSVRFYNCQFIISTHSPFLLALNEARIYDLDEVPVSSKQWYELKNMQIYYDFFKGYNDKFEKNED